MGTIQRENDMRYKEIICSVALVFIFAFSCFGLSSCGEKARSISLDLTNVDTELDYNQDLDLSGLIVKAIFNGGDERIIDAKDYKVDLGGFNKQVAGQYTITITYQIRTATFNVYVNPDLTTATALRVDTTGVDTSFAFGSNFNSIGLQVYAVFTDTEMLLSPSKYTLDTTAYNKDVAGTYPIVITLKGTDITTFYEVTVRPKPKKLVGIRLDTTNVQTVFEWGEPFNSEGLIVYKVYDDDSEEVTTDYTLNSQSYNAEIAGDYMILIILNDSSLIIPAMDNYNVTVNSRAPATVTDIRLDTSNVQLEFAYGEMFNSSELMVYKIMSYGSEVLAEPNEYRIEEGNYSATTPGEYTINVVFLANEALNKTYTVEVLEPIITGIRIDTANAKTSYMLGEAFSSSGIRVYRTFQEETPDELVSADAYTVDYNTFNSAVANTYEITVRLNGTSYSASYNVTVLNQTIVTGISLDTTDAKIEFEWGEAFSSAGLIVEKIQSFGEPVVANESEYIVDSSAYNAEISGTYNISVHLRGTFFTSGYVVVVKDREPADVTDIMLDLTNVQLTFENGQDFSADGLIVNKIMSYGDPVVAEVNEYSVDYGDYNADIADTYIITVSLNGTSFLKTYEVTVKPPAPDAVDLVINTQSAKTTFEWGEAFTSEGLIVQYVMSNSELQDVTEYNVDSSDYIATIAGNYEIIVYAGGFQKSYEVVVSPISQEQLDDYLVFDNITLTSDAGQAYTFDYIEGQTNYSMVYLNDTVFNIDVELANKYSAIDYDYSTIIYNETTTISFDIIVNDVSRTYYFTISKSSPINYIAINNNRSYPQGDVNYIAYKNKQINSPINIELDWNTYSGYSWKFDGEVQNLSYVTKEFNVGQTYTIEIVCDLASTEYTVQTIYLTITENSIIDEVEVEYMVNEEVLTQTLTELNTNLYYAQIDGLISSTDFKINFSGQTSYDVSITKATQNWELGENIFNAIIRNGNETIDTITIVIDLQFTCDTMFENSVWLTDKVVINTYKRQCDYKTQDFLRYYNTYNNLVNQLVVGENNLIGKYTYNGLTYEFDACIIVEQLPISSIMVNNIEYIVDSASKAYDLFIEYNKDFTLSFDYNDSLYTATISDTEYVSGSVYTQTFDINNDYVNIYLYDENNNFVQTIGISLHKPSYIKGIYATTGDYKNYAELQSLGYYTLDTNILMKNLVVEVADGYTYKVYSNNVETDFSNLKIGYNDFTIKVFDEGVVVEEKALRVYINVVDLLIQDSYGVTYEWTLDDYLGTISITNYTDSSINILGDNIKVFSGSSQVNGQNISLTQNITYFTVVFENTYSITGEIGVVKASAIHPINYINQIIVNLPLENQTVVLDKSKLSINIPLNLSLEDISIDVRFMTDYDGYTYSTDIIDGNIQVSIYNADGVAYDSFILYVVSEGIVDSNTDIVYMMGSFNNNDAYEPTSTNVVIDSTADKFFVVQTANEQATYQITGNVEVLSISTMQFIVLDAEGIYNFAVNVTATDKTTTKIYNFTINVSKAYAPFSVTSGDDTISFGGLSQDKTKFGVDTDGYYAYFDSETAQINKDNLTVTLSFDIADGVTLKCGETVINSGENTLLLTANSTSYMLSLSMQENDEIYDIDLIFAEKQVVANFTVNGVSKELSLFGNSSFGLDYYTFVNSAMTVYDESAVVSSSQDGVTTYKVTMNCNNLAQGYTLLDMSTNTAITDTSSFELVLSEMLDGLNILTATVAISNGITTIPVVFVFNDAMEASGFLVLTAI